MLCPYCNNEMKKGMLQARAPYIHWLEKLRRVFISPKGDEVALVKEIAIFSDVTVEAFNCTGCKKIILEYEHTAAEAAALQKQKQAEEEAKRAEALARGELPSNWNL